MIAFLAHAPGLHVIARRPVSAAYWKLNALFLAATLLGMVLAAVALRERGLAGVGVAVTWMLGHFAWSMVLARGVITGKALEERRRARR